MFALHDVIVLRIEKGGIGHDFGGVLVKRKLQAGIGAAWRGVEDLLAMGGENALEDIRRKFGNGIEAHAGGATGWKGLLDELFVFNQAVAIVAAVYSPGQFTCGAVTGKTFFAGLINGLAKERDQPGWFEAAIREIDFFGSVQVQRATGDFAVGVKTEKTQVEEQLVERGRALHAEAAFAVAQAVGDIGRENLGEGTLGVVEDTNVIAVGEFEN